MGLTLFVLCGNKVLDECIRGLSVKWQCIFERFQVLRLVDVAHLQANSTWKKVGKWESQFDSHGKVHIFWEGHKILRNLHRIFHRYYIGQIYGGDFAKIWGLLRIYEPYERRLKVCTPILKLAELKKNEIKSNLIA